MKCGMTCKSCDLIFVHLTEWDIRDVKTKEMTKRLSVVRPPGTVGKKIIWRLMFHQEGTVNKKYWVIDVWSQCKKTWLKNKMKQRTEDGMAYFNAWSSDKRHLSKIMKTWLENFTKNSSNLLTAWDLECGDKTVWAVGFGIFDTC